MQTVGRRKQCVTLTRDSVCMADDVEAPHTEIFEFDADATLADMVRAIARSSYLPMPGGIWGWTIAVGDVVMAVRPGLLMRRVIVLRGDAATVTASDIVALDAVYVPAAAR